MRYLVSGLFTQYLPAAGTADADIIVSSVENTDLS